MKLIIDKGLTNEALIKASPLFGQAVFVECGWHSPLDFCFDHHDLENTTYMLSSSAMIQQEVIRGRKMPVIIVMNHFRHLDNILAAFLFMNPELAVNPDVSLWALSADLIDRVGPIAFQAIDLPTRVLLQSIQEMIPLKEWQLTNTELREKAEEVLRKLRSYVVADECK